MDLIKNKKLKEFTQTLTQLDDTGILIELFEMLDSLIGIRHAAAFLGNNNFYQLEVKKGQPETYLVNLDILFVAKNNECIKDDLMKFPEPVYLHDGQNMLINYHGLLKETAFQRNTWLLPLGCSQEMPGFAIVEFEKDTIPENLFLTVLVNQTYLALKYAMAQKEMDRLDNLALILNSDLDINKAYPRFVEELKKMIDFDRLTITLPDKFKEKIQIYALFQMGDSATVNFPLPGSSMALVINTGNYVLEEDLAKSQLFGEDEYLHSFGLRTSLRLPLINKGNVIGALNIASKRPAAYGSKQIKLLTTLCWRISSVIENTLLYDVINNQLQETLIKLKDTNEATIKAFTTVLDARDSGTQGHCLRVAEYTTELAKFIGIAGKELDDMKLGALMHDIGKISIPDAVLLKAGELTDEEVKLMRKHPEIGFELVSKIDFFQGAAPIVLYHHEKFDGTGYPKGIKGNDIPIGARIFAIVDTFDAMLSDRPYRKGVPLDDIFKELIKNAGNQFDPELVKQFIACYENWTVTKKAGKKL